MYKLLRSIQKEILLLLRDMGGLVILFAMPLALIITITAIQDGSFQSFDKTVKIPILLVDKDKGKLSKEIQRFLNQGNNLQILTQKKGTDWTEETAKAAVFGGDYQLAVVIPEFMSRDLALNVQQNVEQILSDFGLEEEEEATETEVKEIPKKEIKLFFDPATQLSFKNAVKSGIEKMIFQLETQSIYKAFQEELGEDDTPLMQEQSFISFKEIVPQTNGRDVLPNSTQHNVPAWTLFAMFFIVIPLSINLVKEKTQGTAVRLRTNPVSYTTILGGKIITYLGICMLQFVLMLLVGIVLFPLMGLPMLDISNNSWFLLFIVALFSGLAAVGFGVLIGSLASTQEQSAPLGATLVVILAAIGGIWVPTFIMPPFMQIISKVSPMNWGLNAFQDVLLRNGSFAAILPEIGLLGLFFLGTVVISILYDKKKRAI